MPIDSHQQAQSLLNNLFLTTNEKIGGTISAAMISSPLWMQYMKHYSEIAALFAPILGCIYLSMQIWFKLRDRSKRED